MKEPKDSAPRAEPWHEADEKPATKRRGPIGTHSLTGGNAEVGLPPGAKAADEIDDGVEERPGSEEPDLLAEPRAGRGDLLGRKG